MIVRGSYEGVFRLSGCLEALKTVEANKRSKKARIKVQRPKFFLRGRRYRLDRCWFNSASSTARASPLWLRFRSWGHVRGEGSFDLYLAVSLAWHHEFLLEGVEPWDLLESGSVN